MSFKKNIAVYVTLIALAVFGAAGWSLALKNANNANAHEESSSGVDRATLDQLYDAVFHRSADESGANFYTGKNIRTILNDFRNSPEQRYYGALFKSVKVYEEAQRAPGTLSDADKKNYTDLINSALSNLLAWVDTLPDRDICKATMDIDQVRQAIEDAYDRLSAAGKDKAEHGFSDNQKIGSPREIILRLKLRCLKLSPTPTMTPTVTQ